MRGSAAFLVCLVLSDSGVPRVLAQPSSRRPVSCATRSALVFPRTLTAGRFPPRRTRTPRRRLVPTRPTTRRRCVTPRITTARIALRRPGTTPLRRLATTARSVRVHRLTPRPGTRLARRTRPSRRRSVETPIPRRTATVARRRRLAGLPGATGRRPRARTAGGFVVVLVPSARNLAVLDLDRRVRVAFAVDPEEAEQQSDASGDRHRREALDQRRPDVEQLRQGVARFRTPAGQQYYARHGDGEHQRRLHHRTEQPASLHGTDRDHGPEEVARLENKTEAAGGLLVDDGAEHCQAEAHEHSRPPGQAAPRADDETLVPRHGGVIGIRIALAIAYRGHEAHRSPYLSRSCWHCRGQHEAATRPHDI